MAIREYFILWALWILCVFSLAIGIEKMMKIVLWNYLLTALCLTLAPSLWAFMWRLTLNSPDVAQTIAPVFENKIIITLAVYLLMLLLFFLKSRISIHFHVGWLQKIFFTIVCIPLTIVSIATTLQIAVLWLQAFDMWALQTMVATLPIQDIYKQFISYTPIVICIHAIITILVLSHINWIPKAPSFSFKKKESESLPDIVIED